MRHTPITAAALLAACAPHITATQALAQAPGDTLDHLWITRVDTGGHLSGGLMDAQLDPATGELFLCGISGPSGNTDAVVASIDTDGNLRWRLDYNGPGNWHDQARALALTDTGRVLVTGSTPDWTSRAQTLLLALDRDTGDLLETTIDRFNPGASEAGYDLVALPGGEAMIGGGTNGDGSDVLLMRFDDAGTRQWGTTWDGGAWGPYSQDSSEQMQRMADGSVLMMPNAVMADLQPDYYLIKLDPANGSIIWENNYGTRAGEYNRRFVVDDAGDIYITGVGLDGGDAFFTVKVDGDTGAELWRAYDQHGIDDHAITIALDNRGGVYIAGDADIDGNESNFNDLIYAVKRDAATGALLWEFVFGDTCHGCYDVPSSIRVSPAGEVLLLGRVGSPPYGGATILFRLDTATGAEIERATSAQVPAGAMHFDDRGDIYVTTRTRSADTGQTTMTAWKLAAIGGRATCRADLDGDGALTLFDFLEFQNRFDAGDPIADFDGDGALTLFDFLA
ncbi:MAG: PQQ-binding-like beta-propeller repeat protein, partial [Phycisphaerales bacterium JB060]